MNEICKHKNNPKYCKECHPDKSSKVNKECCEKCASKKSGARGYLTRCEFVLCPCHKSLLDKTKRESYYKGWNEGQMNVLKAISPKEELLEEIIKEIEDLYIGGLKGYTVKDQIINLLNNKLAP